MLRLSHGLARPLHGRSCRFSMAILQTTLRGAGGPAEGHVGVLPA